MFNRAADIYGNTAGGAWRHAQELDIDPEVARRAIMSLFGPGPLPGQQLLSPDATLMGMAPLRSMQRDQWENRIQDSTAPAFLGGQAAPYSGMSGPSWMTPQMFGPQGPALPLDQWAAGMQPTRQSNMDRILADEALYRKNRSMFSEAPRGGAMPLNWYSPRPSDPYNDPF